MNIHACRRAWCAVDAYQMWGQQLHRHRHHHHHHRHDHHDNTAIIIIAMTTTLSIAIIFVVILTITSISITRFPYGDTMSPRSSDAGFKASFLFLCRKSEAHSINS